MKRVKRTFAQGLFGMFVSQMKYIPMEPKDRQAAIEAQRRGLGLVKPEELPKGPKP